MPLLVSLPLLLHHVLSVLGLHLLSVLGLHMLGLLLGELSLLLLRSLQSLGVLMARLSLDAGCPDEPKCTHEGKMRQVFSKHLPVLSDNDCAIHRIFAISTPKLGRCDRKTQQIPAGKALSPKRKRGPRLRFGLKLHDIWK
jgi:hypothetical protein